MQAIEKAGYKPGERRDAGARSARRPSSSRTAPTSTKARARRARRSSRPTISPSWSRSYPIVSIEDGMAEDDFGRLEAADRQDRRQMPARRRRSVRHQRQAARATASKSGVANSILVKVNQIGTLTETLAAVEMAHKAGYTAVMSHRSGETEDCDHRRSRGRHQLRADQDRLARPLRPHREIQSAAAHRGGTGRAGQICRPDAFKRG